jgi:hypothetical protein
MAVRATHLPAEDFVGGDAALLAAEAASPRAVLIRQDVRIH